MTEDRKKQASHQRRIIMNNDGNDLPSDLPVQEVTPERFLEARTSPLVGSHVDAIFYCSGVFNAYSHQGDETEMHLTHGEWAQELIRQGRDTLQILCDFGRGHGIEIFWSMRMNDQHDSGDHPLSQWKQDHRDWLMNISDGYPQWSWSAVDYTIPEVREKVFRVLQDVATRYAIDGVELDFFRHLILFKNQMKGEPVTEEHCEMMTGLIRRVRATMDQAAAQRGKPMLLAVRVPDSVGYCKALGIDLEAWLSEGLVDLVTGCGYFKLEPWENLAALGRKYQVPVYACLVRRRIMQGGEPEGATDLPCWRGEALAAWRGGVDGIYTFNRFDPRDQLFRELGDPDLLEELDRVDQTVYSGPPDSHYFSPGFWLKGGRDFIREASQ